MDNKLVSIFPGNVKSYLNDSVFKAKKDDWNPIYISLKNFLKTKKIDIHTIDIAPKQSPYKYIYFDLPYPWQTWSLYYWKTILLNREKNILFCGEPPNILPFNYMKLLHIFFSKVYTWNDGLVDNEQSSSASKKYFKFRLPKRTVGINTQAKKFANKKFLTLINTNKSPFYPFELLSSFGRELYSERIKAIEFFEQRIPNRFYLYGKGWNQPKRYNISEKILGFKKYTTYKGEVGNKIKTLSNFKFCICFENLTDVDGYITEKIFDCFKARCVPVYWGASNIEKYIPNECFIDFRQFNNFEKLLKHLDSIDEKKYASYIKNIEKLLKDKKFIDYWFEEGFAKFFLKEVLEVK